MTHSDNVALLDAGGSALWASVTEVHELDDVQMVQLLEACRQKDRLDKLDAILRGDIDVWAVITRKDSGEVVLKIDAIAALANTTSNIMKQLLSAIRLPDEKGKRPQVRTARGVYNVGGAAQAHRADRIRSVS